jgi:osmotically inducible lipoprotein OsmB
VDKMNNKFLLAVTAATLLAISGCSGMTRQEVGTATGAVVGGLAGGAVLGGTGAVLGGAAIGAVVGHEVTK